jgi:hypothetical protein
VIPGERYGQVSIREIATFVLIAIVVLGATILVVERRRPG